MKCFKLLVLVCFATRAAKAYSSPFEPFGKAKLSDAGGSEDSATEIREMSESGSRNETLSRNWQSPT
jgi:hypothetical protein